MKHWPGDGAAVDDAVDLEVSEDQPKLLATAEITASDSASAVFLEVKADDVSALLTKPAHHGAPEKSGSPCDKDGSRRNGHGRFLLIRSAARDGRSANDW